jgi:putative hemolysin
LSGVIFYPLVLLLNSTGAALLRLFRIPSGGEARHYSTAELRHLVRESHEEGVVSEEEQRLIRNILNFGEREVRQVMLPRLEIQAIPMSATWEEVRRVVEEAGYSRYPVYRKDLDDVVGILHIKDFIARDVLGEPASLNALVRRVPRVPEATPVERLLASFKRLHVHMAIVVDEHGGTSGIVTLDDLLEEVVGEVEDEFDEGERSEVEAIEDGRFLVSGTMQLVHFNERFAAELTARESTTVAGYVLERIKRAPRQGDRVTAGGLALTVHELDGLAIRRLLLEPAGRIRGTNRGAGQ